ncbi:Lsr2 family protein [Rhodococcus sp. T2V]|uniref:Lsr2 dimerization domain-containing protein n=1 Tax=Rhodococcus sp. T2V TaxID=3034164 RepID=UPI0023E175C6|nr:histone-like nucleoid-structuring protein Lsr2 [Rhodococcus sp. T2V]MDF3309842.1 Lsr2 family protein [Rhodococcus sp. T2V]
MKECYAVDGVEYVIDQRDERAKELRETFECYIVYSPRVGAANTARTGRPPRSPARRRVGETKTVRAWACERATPRYSTAVRWSFRAGWWSGRRSADDVAVGLRRRR